MHSGRKTAEGLQSRQLHDLGDIPNSSTDAALAWAGHRQRPPAPLQLGAHQHLLQFQATKTQAAKISCRVCQILEVFRMCDEPKSLVAWVTVRDAVLCDH